MQTLPQAEVDRALSGAVEAGRRALDGNGDTLEEDDDNVMNLVGRRLEVCLLILVAMVVISVVVSCYRRKKKTAKRLAQETLEGHLAVAQLEDGWIEQGLSDNIAGPKGTEESSSAEGGYASMGVVGEEEDIHLDIIIESMEGGETREEEGDDVERLVMDVETGAGGEAEAAMRTAGGLIAATYRWVRGQIKSRFIKTIIEVGGERQSEALAMACSGLENDMARFHFHKLLGEGNFGEVSHVAHKIFGGHFAMKTVKAEADDSATFVAKLEMLVLLRIQRKPHDNLISALAIDDTQVCLPILLPMAERDMFHVISEDGWPMEAKLRLLLDTAEGVGHLHEELRIVHLDLKPENVLVFNHPHLHAKVADFGYAREIGEQCDMGVGTLGYASLEVVSGSFIARPRHDVFSVAAMVLLACVKADYRTANMFVHPRVTTWEEDDALEELDAQDLSTASLEVEVMQRVLTDGTFHSEMLVPETLDGAVRSPDEFCGHLRRFLTPAPPDTLNMTALKTVISQYEREVKAVKAGATGGGGG